MHLDVAQLEEKAHLRNSVRTTRTLQDHLKRETLPSADNYHPHFMKIGSRATLTELHLGEPYEQKVLINSFSDHPKHFKLFLLHGN